LSVFLEARGLQDEPIALHPFQRQMLPSNYFPLSFVLQLFFPRELFPFT
jgi:hypothetical protein